MNKYELVVMLDAHASQDQKEATIGQVQDLITKNSGKVLGNKVWVEKQKISFQIKGKDEFTYYLVEFEGPGETPVALRSALRLNEEVLRFLMTKREKLAV